MSGGQDAVCCVVEEEMSAGPARDIKPEAECGCSAFDAEEEADRGGSEPFLDGPRAEGRPGEGAAERLPGAQEKAVEAESSGSFAGGTGESTTAGEELAAGGTASRAGGSEGEEGEACGGSLEARCDRGPQGEESRAASETAPGDAAEEAEPGELAAGTSQGAQADVEKVETATTASRGVSDNGAEETTSGADGRRDPCAEDEDEEVRAEAGELLPECEAPFQEGAEAEAEEGGGPQTGEAVAPALPGAADMSEEPSAGEAGAGRREVADEAAEVEAAGAPAAAAGELEGAGSPRAGAGPRRADGEDGAAAGELEEEEDNYEEAGLGAEEDEDLGDSTPPADEAAEGADNEAAMEDGGKDGRRSGPRARGSLMGPETLHVRSGELFVVLKRRGLSIRQLEEALNAEIHDAVLEKLRKMPTKADFHYVNVDVSDNDLGAEGVAILVAFLRRLHDASPRVCVNALRLYRNKLGDEGARSLVELIHFQSRPLTELHLSHNGITGLGAAMIVLAFGSSTAAHYPFRLANRHLHFGGCWLRLERNDIEAPEALVAAIKAQGEVRIVETTWTQREWGPCRAPSWATSEEHAPQVILHVFSVQSRAQKGGGKGKELLRARDRERQHARELVRRAAEQVQGVAADLRSEAQAEAAEAISDGEEPAEETEWHRAAAKEAVRKALHLVGECVKSGDDALERGVRRHVSHADDPEREVERIGWAMSRLRVQGYLRDSLPSFRRGASTSKDHGPMPSAASSTARGPLEAVLNGGASAHGDGTANGQPPGGASAGSLLLQSLRGRSGSGQDSALHPRGAYGAPLQTSPPRSPAWTSGPHIDEVSKLSLPPAVGRRGAAVCTVAELEASLSAPATQGAAVCTVAELEASLGARPREAQGLALTSLPPHGASLSSISAASSASARGRVDGQRSNGIMNGVFSAGHFIPNGFSARVEAPQAPVAPAAPAATAADCEQRDKKKGKNKIGAWQAEQAAMRAEESQPQAPAGAGAGDFAAQAEERPSVIVFQ